MSSKPKSASVGAEAIPLFYPDEENQDMVKWLGKIDELKVIHDWDDITTTHYVTSRLRGCALKWYNSLPSVNFSWSEWKEKLLKAFPVECDYADLFDKMMKRVKNDKETMLQYYYDKLSLLNLCEISGCKAVSLIIAGIPDANVKSAAKVGNFSEPDELLKLLKTVGDSDQIKRTQTKTNLRATPNTSRKWQDEDVYKRGSYTRSFMERPRKCYHCGDRDHISISCPKRSQHFNNSAVRQTKEMQKRNTSTKQVFMAEQDKVQGKKYFMNIKVDHLKIRAFVDFGANCNILKNEIFIKLGRKLDGGSCIIKGFGGGVQKTLGVVKIFNVEVDQARAQTDFAVVPDEAQEIPAIIRQPFTEQNHVKIYKDNKILCIYEQFDDILPQEVAELPPVKIPKKKQPSYQRRSNHHTSETFC